MRAVADRHHRLGNGFGVFAQPHPQAAAEQDDFHERSPRKATRFGGCHVTDGQLGNRHDERAAPFARVGQLRHDLFLQVPRQDQDVVGPRLGQPLGCVNRNVRARQKLAVLVRIAVDRVVQEIGADAAIVQQRVALARRAVADNLLAGAAGRDQELQQLALGLLDLLGEVQVGVQLAVAGGQLGGHRAPRPAGRSAGRIVGMAGVNRAASRRASGAPRRRTPSVRGPRTPCGPPAATSSRSARGRSCRTGFPRPAAAGAGTPSSARRRAQQRGLSPATKSFKSGTCASTLLPTEQVGG